MNGSAKPALLAFAAAWRDAASSLRSPSGDTLGAHFPSDETRCCYCGEQWPCDGRKDDLGIAAAIDRCADEVASIANTPSHMLTTFTRDDDRHSFDDQPRIPSMVFCNLVARWRQSHYGIDIHGNPHDAPATREGWRRLMDAQRSCARQVEQAVLPDIYGWVIL